MWDYEDCARLTGAEPHAKETPHRAEAVGPTPTVYASSKPRLRPAKSPTRPQRLRSLIGATAVPALIRSSRSPVEFGMGLSDPNSALPFKHPTPDQVIGPSASAWRLARSSCHRSCNTRALARRANRCVTDPSRANATRGGTFLSRQKAGENHAPTRIQFLAHWQEFFAFSMSWGILSV
jgi:hypothetical protein